MKSEKKQNKHFIIIISCIAAIGGFLFGFDTGVISGTLIFLQDAKGWALTDSQLGGVTTAVLLGAVLGCLISGKITDMLGRKKIIIITSVIFMCGALLSGSAPRCAFFNNKQVVSRNWNWNCIIFSPSLYC